MIQHLIDAYVALLKISNGKVRIELQPTYCYLRDTIAHETDQESQFVQEKYEEISLIESRPTEFGMLGCVDFKKFIGETNLERISGWPTLVNNYWDNYKYTATEKK